MGCGWVMRREGFRRRWEGDGSDVVMKKERKKHGGEIVEPTKYLLN